MIPGAPNPADGLKEVAKELKEKFEEAGMDKVDQFVDKLDDLKEKAASAPEEIMNQVQAAFKELSNKFDEAMADPASLVPGGGAMAMVAGCIANGIVSKLKALAQMVEDMIKTLVDLASKIVAPMKKLGEVLADAMKALEASLKKLSKLPKELGDMASSVGGPDDVAKIEVDPMKKCLNVSGIDAPLGSISGMKDTLSNVVDLAKAGIQKLVEFVESLPKQIKNAFELPCSCCCSAADSIPQLKMLLEMVDKVQAVPTKSLLDIMEKTADAVCNMDIDAVKKPVETFAQSAGDSIDKLEKTVKGAKLASNPTGAVGGMMPKF